MPIFLLLAALWIAFFASPTFAVTVEEALAGCGSAPKFDEHFYPGDEEIARTNNLRRQAGSAFPAGGTAIFVKGKILDDACQPVAGVRIDLWQADSDGALLKPSQEEDFLGSGRTYSNNLGEYSFITVLPGKAKDGGAPHLNFGINAEGFSPLYTRMYFPGRPENAGDKALAAAKKENPFGIRYARAGKDDTYIYNIRLTPGMAPVKKGSEESDSEEDEDAATGEDKSAPEDDKVTAEEPDKPIEGGKIEEPKDDMPGKPAQ